MDKLEITHLCLDMDGVLVNQSPHLAYLEDISVQTMMERNKEMMGSSHGKVSYVMQLIEKHLHTNKCFQWCPPTSEYYELMEIAKAARAKGVKVVIASSVTTDVNMQEEIERQKRHWLTAHRTIDNIDEVWLSKGSVLKKNFAECGRLLVDDYGKNIEEWQALGGIGIKHFYPSYTVDMLRKYLDL